MPKRGPTCTKCGRKVKGHLGITGKRCHMDELLEKRLKKDGDSEHSEDESEDASGTESEGDVKPEVPESPKVKSGRKLTINERFEAISSQVAILATTVSEFVSPTSSVVAVGESPRKIKT